MKFIKRFLVLGLIFGFILFAMSSEVTFARDKSLEINIFLPEASQNISALTNLESDLGVKFNSCKYFMDWSEPFNSSTASLFSEYGCLPELTWQPQIGQKGVSYDGVIRGGYDDYIDNFARDVRSFGLPIRINLAPEMNSDWALWGIAKGNNTESQKLFWRYVVNRFRLNGATNVSWVWAPNVRYGGDLCSYSDIYPGDEYVDYVGLDGYNWGTSQPWSNWQSFSDIFERSYNELVALTSKDILIMEVASAESGGNKADWIARMFLDAKFKFPRIKGITWFSMNKETDWRIDSSQDSKTVFSDAANGRVKIAYGLLLSYGLDSLRKNDG